MKNNILLIFLIFNQVVFSQCLTLNSSKSNQEFLTEVKLLKTSDTLFRIGARISDKFFPDKENRFKIVGYEDQIDKHPNAFATSDSSSYYFKKSDSVAGSSNTGYIWLDNFWIKSVWKNQKYKLTPELVFLLAHEAGHIFHEKDMVIQRKVELDENGKPKFDIETGQPIFKTDAEGNYIGFFDYIPKKLKERAKELHADYAGGIVLYDLSLFVHDSWTNSEDELIRNAHSAKYNSMLNEVKKFIKNKLAPNPSVSHGTAEERVKYFLQGVNDRRKHVNSFKKTAFRKKVVAASSGIRNLLTKKGLEMKNIFNKQ